MTTEIQVGDKIKFLISEYDASTSIYSYNAQKMQQCSTPDSEQVQNFQ